MIALSCWALIFDSVLMLFSFSALFLFRSLFKNKTKISGIKQKVIKITMQAMGGQIIMLHNLL
ncbi:MAG: hypothetical protein IKR66_06130, partial [Bacteroidales bacterium]|nr:hypothetical protein [Bacteroidales bacterium]